MPLAAQLAAKPSRCRGLLREDAVDADVAV